ncbi:hypothetical protein DCAR_0209610 [Daucus carota subsp. sativus]|uniref:Uncharacterized protein n=1 Tax=Daucus carota subsp. sativus TaxID=79200 RepID=A0A162AYJ2_DAUCS|nr:hypothetical protein DCAR_0209610 [Daucus carota subsp. sativus]
MLLQCATCSGICYTGSLEVCDSNFQRRRIEQEGTRSARKFCDPSIPAISFFQPVKLN